VTQVLLRFQTGWNEGSVVAEKLLIIDGDLAIAELVRPVAHAHSIDDATHAGQILDASNHTFHDNAFKQRPKRRNRIVALATCGHCRGLINSAVSAAMSIWVYFSILSIEQSLPAAIFLQ
jgi:hypothetical protein